MIAEFNRRQVFWGACGIAGSIGCYVLAWLFFNYGAAAGLHTFNFSTAGAPWLAVLALAGITFSGWRTWKNGQGYQSYAESVFYHDLGGAADTAGAHLVDHYVGQITGPAYVLSQAFLGGPLLLLKSIHRLRRLIPNEAGLEQRLAHMLAVLHTASKWQGLPDYPGQEREILLLGLMKKIDFSQHKGKVRFKASTSDGI